MAEQLLNGWKRHRRAIQSIGSRIKQCFGERVTQIVGTERRSEFGCLTKLGNDLANAAFGQRSAPAQQEMPIRPTTLGSHRFSLDHCPLSPVVCQMFAVFEVGIEGITHFLDKWDLAMLESFAPSNDE